jgi:hypothetical protein
MIDVLNYPPLMGMFYAGYVLHRAWHAWTRHRRLKSLDRFEERIVFVEWFPNGPGAATQLKVEVALK